MGCLDEEILLAFAEGRLSQVDRQNAEEHIDRCPSCRWLLGRLALSTSDSHATTEPRSGQEDRTDPPDQVDDSRLSAGTVIDGDYVIRSQIGSGGMGSVYLATDQRLQRPVAVKMINRNLLGSSDLVERFVFEARVTARFNHPNIISVYGAGESDGRPYLVLEYVAGESLRQRMRSGPPLTLDQTIDVARSLASALAEAHRHSVLHRDLKPGNVMLAHDGRVRVLDFGLARLLGSQPTVEEAQDGASGSSITALHRTRTEGFKGTPRYMAPEQWRGESVTRATDVWPLGVILFQLAFGRHPIDASGPVELQRTVISDEPVEIPPVPGRHAFLRRIIAGCLEKDPGRRPTADQLVQWLDEGPPAGARWRWRWVLLALTLLGLAGALVGVRSFLGHRDGEAARGGGAGDDGPQVALPGQKPLARSPDARVAVAAAQRSASGPKKRPLRTRIRPRKRRPVRAHSPAALGMVNIQATDRGEPRAVVVLLDGKVVGETPLQLFKVPEGIHYLAVRHDAYRGVRKRIILKRDEKKTVLFRLERRAPPGP